ncbi:DUF2804 domain-containing protein [Brevibacillus daliensis]|uniref:DUF2804 domain-containing protein n=1 Tax=Brevibacillus daliensis TaxID=2892995 RepID=UPI001E3DCF9D|nr:DUF2804 domain-containing protein [Brevibacillus daliensis]
MSIVQSKLQELEITDNVQLCNENGELRPEAIGWSRHPLHICAIPKRFGRKKKWNFWFVTSNEIVVTLAVVSLDYIGLVFFHSVDLATGKKVDRTVQLPFAKGIQLPDELEGDVLFTHPKLSFSFKQASSHTQLDAEGMGEGGEAFSLALRAKKREESLHVVIPWDKKRFQYTSKQAGRATNGLVTIDDKTHQIEANTAASSLDFGRGVWPYQTEWNWTTCSFIHNNKWCGFNFGAGWTDGTGMTENAIMVGEKVEKISEQIEFIYDQNDKSKPWLLNSTESNRIQLMFTPVHIQMKDENYGLIRSRLEQYIGKYSGKIITEDGSILQLQDIWGICEEQKAKW